MLQRQEAIEKTERALLACIRKTTFLVILSTTKAVWGTVCSQVTKAQLRGAVGSSPAHRTRRPGSF